VSVADRDGQKCPSYSIWIGDRRDVFHLIAAVILFVLSIGTLVGMIIWQNEWLAQLRYPRYLCNCSNLCKHKNRSNSDTERFFIHAFAVGKA